MRPAASGGAPSRCVHPAPPRQDEAMTTQPIATRDPGARLSATRVKLGEFEYEIGPLGHLAVER